MEAANRQAEEAALQGLSHEYALGLDEGDGARFAAAFLPEGKLLIYRALDAPAVSSTTGREGLSKLPQYLADHYDQTLHFLGQCVYKTSTEQPSGFVYCLAHHFNVAQHGGIDHVMHMTYQDTYKRDADGDWKIAERHGYIRWTETRATNPLGL